MKPAVTLARVVHRRRGELPSGRRSLTWRLRMSTRSNVLATIALTSLSLWCATTASANELETCGGVFLEGDASCEFRPKEECMTECMTTKVETACVAKIHTSCESSCTATATASCETRCTETCTNDCDTAAVPTCAELCAADCDGRCGDHCEGDGPCNSCCSHHCSKKCDRRCADEAPPEECEPTCATACMGSCTAQATVDCQIDCQTEQYVECEEEMVETCETECETTGGAIFCNGQFLAAEDINDCADELAADIDIRVEVELDVEAEVDVDVNGGGAGDSGDDNGLDCSVASVRKSPRAAGPWVAALGLLAVAGVVYRRTRRAR